jgi:DNA-binding NarL/FixJ family response regulator
MNLMIVDDHAGMRSTIRQLISAPGDVVLECGSGDEAVKSLEIFRPDCVTVDVSMPGLCAFKTMRTIRDQHPSARVICVTSHDLPEYRRAAYDAGASGFVLKDSLSDLYLLVATKRLLARLHL